MKKKKVKKKKKFNLADYDYMDDLSLFGWGFEFAIRNSDTNEYGGFADLKKTHPKKELFLSKNNSPYLHFVKSASLRKLNCIAKPAIFKHDKKANEEILGVKLKGLKIIKQPKIHQRFKRLYTSCIFNYTDESPEKILKKEKNPYSIMFIVDATGSQKLILQEFEKQLSLWKKDFKRLLKMPTKRMSTAWKYHLMVYDLHKKHKLDFGTIAAIVYPNETNDYSSNYPATKKARKNYKTAFALIDNGYKKYIPDIPSEAILFTIEQ